jgi:2-keto-4-pentenoate hydratase/2-oxohepta-3-ene-1,7-dioic acid hydratase in catechol pathway
MSRIRIKNSDEYITVQNVYCVGKNYLDHIKEFDAENVINSVPVEPIIFLKPNTSVSCDSKSVSIPEFKGKNISDNLQNEVELVIVVGKDGKDIAQERAYDHILGYAVGIDFTLRDIQSELKKKGLPWTLSKGFWGSAPVSSITGKEESGGIEDKRISLQLNGETKQKGNTSEMIFKVPYLIYYISHIFGIRKGDLIFTGTPAGVTKLNKGDLVRAEIESIGELNIRVE